MRIPIDRQHITPLYQQIETYLRQSIVAGTLAPTTRLPAARQVAQDLGVSRITVENAYAALESDGLVERRIGSGTYVLPPGALPSGGSSGTVLGHCIKGNRRAWSSRIHARRISGGRTSSTRRPRWRPTTCAWKGAT